MWIVPTAAIIDIVAANTVTLLDAFQFGTVGDTTWNFNGQNFKMEVKADAADPVALATWSNPTTIVVDDPILRVLHLNVSEAALQAALPVGEYVYDLVMYDGNTPSVRVMLMQGKLFVTQGVTES